MFPNSLKKRDKKKGKMFSFFPLKFALGLDMNKNPYLDIYELWVDIFWLVLQNGMLRRKGAINVL